VRRRYCTFSAPATREVLTLGAGCHGALGSGSYESHYEKPFHLDIDANEVFSPCSLYLTVMMTDGALSGGAVVGRMGRFLRLEGVRGVVAMGMATGPTNSLFYLDHGKVT